VEISNSALQVKLFGKVRFDPS